MKMISCHGGVLRTQGSDALGSESSARGFSTGLDAMDLLAPQGVLARGAVHELLSEPCFGLARFCALILAKAALRENGGKAMVWCDPRREVYPPAIARGGIPLDRVYLLRPQTLKDEVWAITECLRSPAIGVTIASPARLSRIEARRIQLAAERGGGVGFLLRHTHKALTHAATTRWLVGPHPGERMVQRWRVQLIHGHGGRVGESVILEVSRETNLVRASQVLADRPLTTSSPSGVSTG